jgi:hypothetical protein
VVREAGRWVAKFKDKTFDNDEEAREYAAVWCDLGHPVTLKYDKETDTTRVRVWQWRTA